MDRVFLEYYEEELTHIRALAAEFADMHPAVARNLSLDTVPAPIPTSSACSKASPSSLRAPGSRSTPRARASPQLLDVLYPDLVRPPRPLMAVLSRARGPDDIAGHVVTPAPGCRRLQPGLPTRSSSPPPRT